MSNPRILVVEDEGIIARDIKSTLSLLGYSVVAVASSGEEAVKTAMETHPDLVLMDIVLEGNMDGVKVAEHIRDRFDIPVIYLTAYSDDTTLQRAKITEPYGYILKPFQERELYTTIEMALYKHKMERKLKKNEQWLATTLKSIADAVIATDTGKLITFMNPVAEALTGWRQEEAIGKPLKDVFKIINKKNARRAEDPATRVLREGVVVGLANHTVLIAKDGTKRPVDDSSAPIRDDKGRTIGVVLVFRDITDRKIAETQLRESEEKLKAIFECANDGILVVDLEKKKILTGNTMICEMLGYSPEEIKNLKATDIHPQEDLPYILNKIEEQARGKYPLSADIPVKRKDGSIFYADINSSRINFYGKPCIMGIFRDITKRKRMQDSLLKSEKQLRTLSSSILSAQEQDRKRISRELHDDLGQTLTAVLVDISRAEKQKIFISSGCYSFIKRLRLILQEALQRVRNLSAILRPGVLDQLGLKAAVISFLEEMEEQTGLKIIEEMQVDHSNIPESVSIAIYRILQEATTNIIKYAAAKQVIVKLQSDFRIISISIKDDGQGFNPEALPIDKGLGLLGMKERVEWLGGVFKIESAHGRGTSIYAEFPLSSRKLAT